MEIDAVTAGQLGMLIERAAAEIEAGETTDYDRGLARGVLARVEEAEKALEQLGERVRKLSAHRKRAEAMVRAAAVLVGEAAGERPYECRRYVVNQLRERGVDLDLAFENRLDRHPMAAIDDGGEWQGVFVPDALRQRADDELPDGAIGTAVRLLEKPIQAELRDGYTDPDLFVDGLLIRYGGRAAPALLAFLADPETAAANTARWASVRRRAFFAIAKWPEREAEVMLRAALEVGWNVELRKLDRASALRRELVARYADSPYGRPF